MSLIGRLFAAALIVTGSLAGVSSAAQPITLPIYIEDSHAGSFYWLAKNLDWDEEVTLLNFDAHSDTSAIFDSDLLRDRMRRVSSPEQRNARLEEWRKEGTVQCFDWIEPLMPAPVAHVVWIPGEELSAAELNRRQADCIEYLDAHLEAAPRRAGSFQGRCTVASLKDMRATYKDGEPLVATIDLDYFAGMTPAVQILEFERVWRFVTERRNLRAITFGISRPYLTDNAESHRLLKLAIEGALSLPTATIQFEPFAPLTDDCSKLAMNSRRAGKPVPLYDVQQAPQELRALILANRERFTVENAKKRWVQLLRSWEHEAPSFHIELHDLTPSTDGIWRVPVADGPEVEIKSEASDVTADVEWIAMVPLYPSCNLISQRQNEAVFATNDPPRPRWREVVVEGTKGSTLAFDNLMHFFDARSGCGSLRLKARVRAGDYLRETPVVEFRRFAGTGFRAAISEQFGLPYLFGSGQLRKDAATGPETGWGADCANFIICALRRIGRCIPWSDPKQLRRFLEPIASPAAVGKTRFTKDDLEAGLVVHFGTHVATVMEDRPPLGVLDAGDLVAHQLEGTPEILPLGELLKRRDQVTCDLLRVPHRAPTTTVLVGGDTMLARTVGRRIEADADPFSGIRAAFDRASLRVINLECVISDKGAPADKLYCFRAPLRSVKTLQTANVDVVALANNHAGDFGSKGLLDCISRLKNVHVIPIGAGTTLEAAANPALFQIHGGRKVAILAICDLDEAAEMPGHAATIMTASARDQLAQSIAKARNHADFIICLVHWGEENTTRTTEKQRSLARWLVDAGVDVVAGSHPHRIQALDSYHGHPILYSLGNLVFDGANGVPAWENGELLEIGLPDNSAPASVNVIPIHLDAAGFPSLAPNKPEAP